MKKPKLSFWQIIQMNIGFLGLQFSFGLQQSNMGPIYSYLGASERILPLLWLAGPVTGLLVQPLIGALSDRTTSRWGRRTPYFMVGALLCSVSLLAMPYSPALWVAAVLLWVLDAANNVTMEPYRAFVNDRLDSQQVSVGFLTQSAFTGLAQTLSYLAPTLLVMAGLSSSAIDANHIPVITRVSFLIGAVLSVSTIAWSVWRVPELPLPASELVAMRANRHSFASTVGEVRDAIVQMPLAMRQLALMMLFQWYAITCYWQYVSYSIAATLFHTADPATQGFRNAVLVSGQVGGFYNAVAALTAFAMVPVAKRFGPRILHAVCLCACGIAMIIVPGVQRELWLFVPMIGIGLGWASMMGNTYVMLADCIPPARTGVYMGIFNMFIVIPMLLQSVTLPLIYQPLLHGDPRNVLVLSGALMIVAALATLRVRLSASLPADRAPSSVAAVTVEVPDRR